MKFAIPFLTAFASVFLLSAFATQAGAEGGAGLNSSPAIPGSSPANGGSYNSYSNGSQAPGTPMGQGSQSGDTTPDPDAGDEAEDPAEEIIGDDFVLEEE
jgi:hypothetical protein